LGFGPRETDLYLLRLTGIEHCLKNNDVKQVIGKLDTYSAKVGFLDQCVSLQSKTNLVLIYRGEDIDFADVPRRFLVLNQDKSPISYFYSSMDRTELPLPVGSPYLLQEVATN